MKKLWFSILSFFGLPHHKTPIPGEDIPEIIRHKYLSMYPDAYNIEWSLYKGVYEARFVNNGFVSVTFFKRNGELIKQFKLTSIHKLPKEIIKNITKDSSGYAVVEVLMDEYHDDPKYKITFRKEKTLIEADCDTSGNIISRVAT